ncbi:MAG: RNA-directed DNA polymerase [Zetaproteobacteria bacterium]|nr:RNA-directed DNA polymerase [Zetaproteobacteria bacterium]
MSLSQDFVLKALLQYNYLPTQRKASEELPPVFTTESFTPEVARKITEATVSDKRKAAGGFDAVEFRMTRFNGVSRMLSLPHPVAHAHLSLCIHDNWNKLEYITTNNANSVIRPYEHEDGRVIIMDYEASFEKTKRSLSMEFGNRFRAHTDIATCYPSIYSHSLPWALVGIETAKLHKPPVHKEDWFNQLDEKVRWNKRNETNGIPIGPATSNIITEAILARVDESLRERFKFVRFVDDYTAYCESEKDAREFIRLLGEELGKYKLLLNIKKTKISPLPTPVSEGWLGSLALSLPGDEKIGAYDAVNFLNLAVELSKEHPDGSVLKYAVKALLGRGLTPMAEWDVLPYVLMLSFHHTVLLPTVSSMLENSVILGVFSYGDQLKKLLDENTHFHRSDGMCWVIHYMNKHEVKISDEQAQAIVKTKDCFAMLMLYLSGGTNHQSKVIDFAKGLDVDDLHGLDQYWLLLYQLFWDGKISNLYDDAAFEILQRNNISFVKPAEGESE